MLKDNAIYRISIFRWSLSLSAWCCFSLVNLYNKSFQCSEYRQWLDLHCCSDWCCVQSHLYCSYSLAISVGTDLENHHIAVLSSSFYRQCGPVETQRTRTLTIVIRETEVQSQCSVVSCNGSWATNHSWVCLSHCQTIRVNLIVSLRLWWIPRPPVD